MRLCFVPGWSWGQSEAQRSPFPLPLDHSPGFRASCLLANEGRRESPEPASALSLAGHQHPGLPGPRRGLSTHTALLPALGWHGESEAGPRARAPGWPQCCLLLNVCVALGRSPCPRPRCFLTTLLWGPEEELSSVSTT